MEAPGEWAQVPRQQKEACYVAATQAQERQQKPGDPVCVCLCAYVRIWVVWVVGQGLCGERPCLLPYPAPAQSNLNIHKCTHSPEAELWKPNSISPFTSIYANQVIRNQIISPWATLSVKIPESPGCRLNCALLANDGDMTVLAQLQPWSWDAPSWGQVSPAKGSESVCGELPRPEAGVGVAPPLMNTFLCYSTVKQACHGVLVLWIDMHSERFCWKKKNHSSQTQRQKVEWQMLAAGGGRLVLWVQTFSFVRWNSSGDWLYSVVNVVFLQSPSHVWLFLTS